MLTLLAVMALNAVRIGSLLEVPDTSCNCRAFGRLLVEEVCDILAVDASWELVAMVGRRRFEGSAIFVGFGAAHVEMKCSVIQGGVVWSQLPSSIQDL